jgi:hypothetical protein
MALIPGFTPLAGRRFIDVASLVVVDKIEVNIGPLEEKQLEALVRHVARDIQAQMIRSFRDPKTGRVYKDHKGRDYRASAPGQPPAIRSGRLLSETFKGISFPQPTEADLVINTGYETFLELGTRRMRARPFVFPSINEVLDKLQQADVIESYTRVDRLDMVA